MAALAADVRRADQVRAMVEEVTARLGTLDILSWSTTRRRTLQAEGPWSAHGADDAIRSLNAANALVAYYRGLLLKIRYAAELGDLAWLDL
jgi:NAD(P)-dependent dehydrogenase (short-subunit alcohol dehydrogenase family)